MRNILLLAFFLLLACIIHSQETNTTTPTESLQTQITNIERDVNRGWTLSNAYLVFFMNAGFAFLEAGSVRAKNVQDILLKNLMTTGIVTVGFWAVGYGFAFGDDGGSTRNQFIGNSDFMLLGTKVNSANFIFQWSFACASTSIVSGAVAERLTMYAYFLYAIFMSAVIYPVVAHWIWGSTGWLSGFNTSMNKLGNIGSLDFAGGIVVHYVGGLTALIGAIMVGPRTGRFRGGVAVPMGGHNKTLIVLGGFVLYFGWFGFNSGSTLALTQNASYISAHAAANTAIAAGFGAVMTMIMFCVRTGHYDLAETVNGAVAGCVIITPCCAYVPTWVGALAGCFSAIVYTILNALIEKIRIDDPVGAVAIHGGCGSIGFMIGALFAQKEHVAMVYGISAEKSIPYGLFLGGGWELLGVHALTVVVTTAWVAVLAFALFLIIKLTIGLRLPETEEYRGLDQQVGGVAYDIENLGLGGEELDISSVNPSARVSVRLPSLKRLRSATEQA